MKRKEAEEALHFQKRLQEIYDEFDSSGAAAADLLAIAAEVTNQRTAAEDPSREPDGPGDTSKNGR